MKLDSLASLFLNISDEMSTTKIPCQVPGCEYVAEHSSEAVAIAMYSSHNSTHAQSPTTVRRTQIKAPQIPRPELKQDVSAEDWYSFKEEWTRFKRIIAVPTEEVADQLFQCCDRTLGRLLLKENPDIIEAGEPALLEAMKNMAVLQVAKSVRRTKLLTSKQDHGQLFREFYANVRASASTCEYEVKCPHECCAERGTIDYTPKVVKDILIVGIADEEIRKEVLSTTGLDDKTDKDIVQLVEEKEIARNACDGNRSDIGALSSYNRQKRNISNSPESTSINKKLALKGKCPKCNQEMNLFIRYRSGKMNNQPFKYCIKCHKSEKLKTDNNNQNNTEAAEIINFLDSMGQSDDR